jgi:TRAP-type uncharacterized transport system fused permease subunit
MRTLGHALIICVGLFILMAGVFTRPELVIEPGLAQMGAMVLITTTTIGITFSLQANFVDHRGIDALARIVLAAFALVVLLHPNRQYAWLACIPVGLFVSYWILRRRDRPVSALAGTG